MGGPPERGLSGARQPAKKKYCSKVSDEAAEPVVVKRPEGTWEVHVASEQFASCPIRIGVVDANPNPESGLVKTLSPKLRKRWN